MVIYKKNSGKRVLSDVNDPSFVQSLASICFSINSSSLFIEYKSSINESLLAKLVVNLILHYEKNYGKDSPKPRPISIPNFELFNNFTINGPLHVILSTLLVGATIRDLLPFDTLFENESSKLLPILFEIDKELEAKNFKKSPKVFLNKVPVNLINNLTKITLQHGGKLVTNEECATHVIDWNEETDKNLQENVDNSRFVNFLTVETANDFARLHWSYYPDRYDEIVSSNNPIFDSNDSNIIISSYSKKERYYVSCRFLFDCELFNEWGNELDYELPVDEEVDGGDNATNSNAPGKRLKGKRKSSAGSQLKLAKDIPVLQSITSSEKFFSDILPVSLRSDLSTEASVVALDLSSGEPKLKKSKITSESMDVEIVPDLVPVEDKASDNLNIKEEVVVKEETEPIISNDSDIPVDTKVTETKDKEEIKEKELITEVKSPFVLENKPPSWFSVDSISDLEKKYLGHLIGDIDSESCVSNYITLRNSIVSNYNSNISQYLTATECRRRTSGDVSKIIRIHEFLDTFGVINYSVKIESRPAILEDYSLTLKRQSIADHLLKLPSHALTTKKISESPSKIWTLEMDEKLLTLITPNKMDWKVIASLMDIGPTVTPLQCMMRFLEITLVPPPVQEIAANATAGLVLPNTANPANPTVDLTVSNTEKEVTLPIKYEIIHKVQLVKKYLKNVELLMNDISSYRKSSEANVNQSVFSLSEELEISEKIISDLNSDLKYETKEVIQLLNTQNQTHIVEYLQQRLKVLENKLITFHQVENLLELERSKNELDKRELLLQKLSQGIIPLPSNSLGSTGSYFYTR